MNDEKLVLFFKFGTRFLNIIFLKYMFTNITREQIIKCPSSRISCIWNMNVKFLKLYSLLLSFRKLETRFSNVISLKPTFTNVRLRFNNHNERINNEMSIFKKFLCLNYEYLILHRVGHVKRHKLHFQEFIESKI